VAKCGLVFGCLLASAARAHLLAHEPFSYAPQEKLFGQSGGSGFAGAWLDDASSADGRPFLVGGSLSLVSAIESGSCLAFRRPAMISRRLAEIEGRHGETLWISFLLSQSFAGGAPDYAVARLSKSDALDLDWPRFGVFADWRGKLFFGSDTLFRSAILSPVPFSSRRTYLVVASMRWDTRPGQAETLRLYVNPAPYADPADLLPALERSDFDIANPADSRHLLNEFAFATGDPPSKWFFDELRIGTSYGDVVPMPQHSPRGPTSSRVD
jgi:hypothetical protein